eukprot:TRINITY_DN1255_c0_g2_i1.p1 TRINITY_DN1255_c0_g2~~TRINITY_DN1255_c0_g2_i1.p1  ORF type:complete len:701 (+),score=108.28 TRINITY_DN1255_c0_g2_i1:150-2252(+)
MGSSFSAVECLPCLPGTLVDRSAHSGESTEVLVIGAGLAGLACALRLQDRGLSCVVLEARNRVAGRAGRGGADFVHGQHVATWRYIRRFDMRTNGKLNGWPESVSDEGGQAWFYVDGKLEGPDEWRPKASRRLFFDYVEEKCEEWIAAGREDTDVMSVLRESFEEPLSDDEVRLLETQMAEWNAADLCDLGVYDYDTSSRRIQELVAKEPHLLTDDGGEGHHRIVGGHSGLAEKMAKTLDVRFEHVVKQVDWSEGNARVTCTSGRVFSGKRVVVTVPLACIPDIKFSPALPKTKQTAVQSLGRGVTTSVYIRFKDRFWPERMAFLFHPMSSQCFWPGIGRNVLTAFFGGRKANNHLLAMTDQEMVDEIVKQLETIFSKPGGLKDLVLSSEVSRWDNDPYAKMAYSYCPVNAAPMRIDLRESCGALLWAGEATHPTRGSYAHGALEEGERAAEEVVSMLGCTKSATVNSYELVDLRLQDSHLLDEVYSRLLEPNFPISDELDDLEDIRKSLQVASDPRQPEYHVLVARWGQELLGCTCYEYYPRGNFCLMSYICVDPPYRALGVSRKLLDHLERQMRDRARESGKELGAIFAETNSIHTEDGVMDPAVRQSILRSWGFRALDFTYVQPPLSEHHKPCGGMRLLVKDQKELPGDSVASFLEDFAGSVFGWDSPEKWREESYFQAQLAELGNSPVKATWELPW